MIIALLLWCVLNTVFTTAVAYRLWVEAGKPRVVEPKQVPPQPPSWTLKLCDKSGVEQYEQTIHALDFPEEVRHAGRRFAQYGTVGDDVVLYHEV
jgi:hypothetical protein